MTDIEQPALACCKIIKFCSVDAQAPDRKSDTVERGWRDLADRIPRTRRRGPSGSKPSLNQ